MAFETTTTSDPLIGMRSSYSAVLKLTIYCPVMRLGFPIVPANHPTRDARDLVSLPALVRPADAKETAIVCLSAALLFASLAVLALTSER
jgi:hypothetical protein